MPDAPAAPVAPPPEAETPQVAPAQPQSPEPEPSPTTKSWRDAIDALPDFETPPLPEKKPELGEKPEVRERIQAAEKKPEKAPEPKPERAEAPKPEKQPEKAPEKEDDLPPFRTNAELRKWAKERHAFARETENKLKQAETQLAELQATAPKTQAEAGLMAQQIPELQKRIDQYEQILELQSFEHSTKYQKEYAAPYYSARDKAYREISEMMVSVPTGQVDEEGKPTFSKRPATKEDFDKIYALPRAQAREAAKEMFGEDANDVMAMRKHISDLAEKAQSAIVERRENWSKVKQEEEAKKAQEDVAIQRMWQETVEAVSKDPKGSAYWGKRDNDPEWNKKLELGFQTGHQFFGEYRDNLSPKDRVEYDAYILHAIAMGPALAYDNAKLRSELAALKSENAELRGSSPGAPAPVSEEPAPKERGLIEALDALSD